MPQKNERVPQDEDVFRYRSSQHHSILGVPTDEQHFANDQHLIEIDTVEYGYETADGGLRYTGLLSWVGMAQLILIEEVLPNA